MTTLALVARADIAAFTEAARTSGELSALGVNNQHLIINGVFRASDLHDLVARSIQRRADGDILCRERLGDNLHYDHRRAA